MTASNEQVQAVMRCNVSNDFGISRETIYNTFDKIATGRFWYLLRDNKEKTWKIFDIIESEGVSPAVWVAYESSEGYNSELGWLNHTYVDGDVYNDARSVAHWLKNGVGNEPAWDDVYGGTVGMVPNDVRAKGNAEYNSWANDTIGKHYCGGTAAATWAMWYPQGLSARYNGVQDYGNPLATMADLILNVWHGKIDGKNVANNATSPTKPSTPATSTVGIDNSRKRQELEAKVNELFDNIKKKFDTRVFTASEQVMFNKAVKLTKQMNLWKVKLSDDILNDMKKTMDEAIESIVKDESIKVTAPSASTGDKPNQNTTDTQSKPASKRVTDALAKCSSKVGQTVGSGQCYALSGYIAGLISGYTCDMSTLQYGFQALPRIGDGDNAHSLWCGWDWKVAGAKTKGYPVGTIMPASDVKPGMIWCTQAYDSYTGTLRWGHTGIFESVNGNQVTVLEQNWCGIQTVRRGVYDLNKFLAGITGVVWWE